MANIFLLPFTKPNNEDYFTASLEYLIDNVPQIGQKMVDILFAHTNQSPPKFVKAVDHPYLTHGKYPDFLFECEEINILCEYKLTSELGNRQLERYLDLAIQQPKQTYLAFISREQHKISSDLLFSDRYLQPQDKKHFCWQDFYPVIAENQERLAQEFVDFMFSWGMSPPELVAGWEDLFTNPETVKIFRQQWEKVKSHFLSIGAKCSKNGSAQFGFNISYPVSWLHLIYLSVDQEFFTLKANIWLLENSPYLNAFQNIDEEFSSPENRQIFVLSIKPSKAPWKLQSNISPMFVAQYKTALSNILYRDSSST